MDLIALAVPFFLLAIIIEIVVNWRRRAGFYRSNDAINSISAGMLDTTIGYFTKFLPLLAWGFVLENFAIVDMPLAWFDASPRGIALWVAAALAWDFCYYWFHRFSHEISVLWAAHAVHHEYDGAVRRQPGGAGNEDPQFRPVPAVEFELDHCCRDRHRPAKRQGQEYCCGESFFHWNSKQVTGAVYDESVHGSPSAIDRRKD